MTAMGIHGPACSYTLARRDLTPEGACPECDAQRAAAARAVARRKAARAAPPPAPVVHTVHYTALLTPAERADLDARRCRVCGRIGPVPNVCDHC